ncbi:DUF1254 domain-containing protein [Thiocapsa marina]|uniref:Carboxylesterase n=1 Tax=Thiocapsa marina 5811 TaxID=768671 RepID=F9UB92_9GAMM|nr:DUF1254 domain-containing protein [Thiocapsa marina]EGV18710.1 protein of unknown function DUF1214 [Thiocapsa marina 5811]
MKHLSYLSLTVVMAVASVPFTAAADAITVNVDNFDRAQTDMEFAGIIKLAGGVNKLHHNRTPTPIDKQNVIRMNRDTLYSLAVVDLSNGATVTLPDSGKRYMSLMVINNDGYVNEVFYGGGAHELTLDTFDTPVVALVIRTLADPEDEADLAAAHALQDKIEIAAGSDTAFSMPDYDQASYEATLEPILDLAKGLKRYIHTFGSKDEVDPVHFMIGTASAWGGLPDQDAVYVNVQPDLPVGDYELTVKDVPVKGFWSISLYNAKGYFQKNARNAYSLNNLTAKPNSDGSYTIRFGGCGDGVENCLPIMDGWNYAVRMYEPEQSIVDGTWTFPGPPVARGQ